jgi:hypothetical protein
MKVVKILFTELLDLQALHGNNTYNVFHFTMI